MLESSHAERFWMTRNASEALRVSGAQLGLGRGQAVIALIHVSSIILYSLLSSSPEVVPGHLLYSTSTHRVHGIDVCSILQQHGDHLYVAVDRSKAQSCVAVLFGETESESE